MKIMQINSVCGVTSTGRIASQLAVSAGKKGHTCRIAYGELTYANRDPEGISFPIAGKWNNYFHALWTRVTDLHGLASFFPTLGLLGKIRDFDPEVIHLHNLHGYYIHYPLLFHFLKRWKGRVIWTLHDCWALTGHCCFYSYAGCEKWKESCGNCPQKHRYPASSLADLSGVNHRIKKRTLRGMKNLTLTVPSEWMKKQVEESYLKDFPCRVIYNGADPKAFFKGDTGEAQSLPSLREAKGEAPRKFRILGVANVWDDRKRLDVFLKLAPLLPEDMEILLVGLSPAQLEGLPPGVRGLPRTDSVEELAEIYRTSDVLLHPGVDETFGMTVLEAALCGAFPVVTRGSACEELAGYLGGSVVEPEPEIIREELGRLQGISRSKNYDPEKFRPFLLETFCEEMIKLYEETT